MKLTLLLTLFLTVACAFPSHHEGASFRIISGSYAMNNQFPYHVSIIVDSSFRCGGVLISKLFVLTAAHCLFNKNRIFDAYDLQVWVGHISIFNRQSVKITAEVDKVYIPKEYKTSDNWYMNGDIAVLRVTKVMDVPDDWIPMLPQNEYYLGQTGIVTGHGLNKKKMADPNDPKSKHAGTQDGLLRFTDVTIITNAECAEAWSKPDVPDSLVCAQTDGGTSNSLCNGDSGGPLVVGQNEVVGVLSVGSAECQPGFPEIFTRVSVYVDFIYKAVNDVKDPEILAYDLKYYAYQA